MTYFLIIVLLLCIFGMVLPLWPWMQRRKLEKSAEKISYEERIRANVRIHKERLRELANDNNTGRINEEQFEALKQELKPICLPMPRSIRLEKPAHTLVFQNQIVLR